MPKYIFYPGCYISTMLPHVEVAIRFILKKFNIETIELEDLSCCPPKINSIADELFWLTLAVRNLAIAESKGLDILTPCNGCFESFFEAKMMYTERKDLREKVSNILSKLGYKFEGKIKPKHLVEALYEDIGLEKIKEKLKYRLDGMRIAVQPGCHFLWPSESLTEKEEDPFNPVILRNLCEALGAKAPYYSRLIDCCGAGALKSTSPEKALKLAESKFKSIEEEVKADLIVTTCSSCMGFTRRRK